MYGSIVEVFWSAYEYIVRHVKNRQKKILMRNGSLMKVESIADAPLGAFGNIFDLHYAIISLENQFWSSF